MRRSHLMTFRRAVFVAAAVAAAAGGTLAYGQATQVQPGIINLNPGGHEGPTEPVNGSDNPAPQPQQQGISCEEAQQRYMQAANMLNYARNTFDPDSERGWAATRSNLVEYMTYRLPGCQVPNVALAQPLPTSRETAQQQQPAQYDSNGRATVVASIIHSIACDNGKSILVYQYGDGHYRAIKPPYWGSPLGGHDWLSYGSAAAAGCTFG